MQLIKIILIIISSVGYYLYLKRKDYIKDEFIPIFIISSIGVIEFIAGILNIMKLATMLITLIGVIVFIKEILIIKKSKIKFNFSTIIYTIIVLISLYWLKGIILTHYDNFSHWAMIVREMLLKDRLPNFQDNLIIFTSYPPGTACFIYYVCKVLWSSERVMLFAQALLIISSIYTIFAFCNKNKKISYIIAIITTIFLLIGNIYIDQLLVDTVLSVMGLAVLSIIVYYRNDSKKSFLISIPILSLLMLVKNSAIFFIIIDLIVWIVYFIKNNGVKNIFKAKYIALILIPISMLILWKAHTNLVFDHSNTSKHAMSISNYVYNLKQKDTNEIKEISKNIFSRMFSFKDIENVIILILFLVQILLIIISRKDKKVRLGIIKSLILMILSYILYQIGILFMYIFSMPGPEARGLSGYIRYYRTIILFEYGICAISILYFFNNIEITGKYKNIIIKLIIAVILVIPIMFYPKNIKAVFTKISVENDPKIRNKILQLKEVYNIEEEQSYLIYISDEDLSKGYLEYMCKYDFRSPNIRVIGSFDELQNMDEIFNYKYFIIYQKSSETDEFLDIIKGDKNQNVFRFD